MIVLHKCQNKRIGYRSRDGFIRGIDNQLQINIHQNSNAHLIFISVYLDHTFRNVDGSYQAWNSVMVLN